MLYDAPYVLESGIWVSQLQSLMVEKQFRKKNVKNRYYFGILSSSFLLPVLLLKFSICTQLYVKCVKKLKTVTHIWPLGGSEYCCSLEKFLRSSMMLPDVFRYRSATDNIHVPDYVKPGS
jgi:hypothetical protein